MQRITPKQAVQAAYPEAKSRRVPSAGYWYQYRVEVGDVILGVDCCPQGAWRDAASKLPAPISGGSPEAEGGQHTAPATDASDEGAVILARAAAEYRASLVGMRTWPRQSQEVVRKMWRGLTDGEKAAVVAELVAHVADCRADDADWMLEGWFASYAERGTWPRIPSPCVLSASEVVAAEIAAVRGEGRPMGGLAWLTLPERTRWGIKLIIANAMGKGWGIGEGGESSRLARFARLCAEGCPVSFPPAGGDHDDDDRPEATEDAEMAMEGMGLMPVSGGAPEGPPRSDMRGINTENYRNAPGGFGPQAYQWADKPHRLVYDLCVAVEQIRSERDELCEALRQTMGLLEMYDRDYGLPPGWREHTGGADAAMAKALGIPPVSGGAPGPELLPCPRCRAGAIMVTTRDPNRDMEGYHVECSLCRIRHAPASSAQLAASWWNDQAPHPDHAVVMGHLEAMLELAYVAVGFLAASADKDAAGLKADAERVAQAKLAVARFKPSSAP